MATKVPKSRQDKTYRLNLYKYLRRQRNQKLRSPASAAPKNDPIQFGKAAEAADPTLPAVDELDRAAQDAQIELSERRTEAEEDLLESRKIEARSKLITDALEIQKGMQEIRQASLNTFQMEDRASLNKQLIDQEINDIIGSGKAQAGIERAKGETAAEMESLKLAAQGQRLSGTGAKAVTRSQKLLAATRAADARSNSLSRALGLEYEKVAIDRQVDYSNIQKGIAKHSGLSRIAFGIADAAIRYREGFPKGEAERPDVPRGATVDNRGLVAGQGYA